MLHEGCPDCTALRTVNPLHNASKSDESWTTTNVGEAIPGIATPLTWSIWGYVTESALRGGAAEIGALSGAERSVPCRPEDRYVRVFYGRPAMQAQFLAHVGDRMPGTTGREVVRDLFGRVPDGLTFAPTRRRYLAIAIKLPAVFVGAPGSVRCLAAQTEPWWTSSIARVDQLDRDAASRLLCEAAHRLDEAVTLQAAVLLGVVTPLYNALSSLVEDTGIGDTAILSGTGGAEIAVVTDIWRAAHGEIGLNDVIRSHGFHGPGEGELNNAVWREDPAPLCLMIAEYSQRDPDADPRLQGRIRELQREDVTHQLLSALPIYKRPAAALLLRLAAQRILLRGVAKRAFLQSLDVTRASARRLGNILAGEGLIDDADDAFYLTMQELTGSLPPDVRDLVRRRREFRREYQGLELPSDWTGTPVPRRLDGLGPVDVGGSLNGIGVSPGVTEGRARVLTEPFFDDVEPDEILVTPFTDPSWSSVMFISSALVVDIGGALSHAAVVARELGIPCVVNTRNGSRMLKTGDFIRVDGGRGVVEILCRPDSSD